MIRRIAHLGASALRVTLWSACDSSQRFSRGMSRNTPHKSTWSLMLTSVPHSNCLSPMCDSSCVDWVVDANDDDDDHNDDNNDDADNANDDAEDDCYAAAAAVAAGNDMGLGWSSFCLCRL